MKFNFKMITYTIKEWLKILPLELRKIIIEDIIKNFGYNSINNKYRLLSDMLNDFSWAGSIHGHDFYNTLYLKFCKEIDVIVLYINTSSKEELAKKIIQKVSKFSIKDIGYNYDPETNKVTRIN